MCVCVSGAYDALSTIHFGLIKVDALLFKFIPNSYGDGNKTAQPNFFFSFANVTAHNSHSHIPVIIIAYTKVA